MRLAKLIKPIIFTSLATMICTLSGCANPNNSIDPYEKMNRKIYAFNTAVDNITLKPIALAYTKIAPNFVQERVHDFYNNLTSVTTIANDLLQAKFAFAVSDTWRLIFNSTIGLAGFFDVASQFPGLPRHREDFGLTLATWGAKQSPYLVFPIVGPTTFRDIYGMGYDTFLFGIWPYIHPARVSWYLYGGYVIDWRAQFLPADDLIAQSFDPYIFVRNAFLQLRESRIRINELSFKEYLQRYQDGTLGATDNYEATADFVSSQSGEDTADFAASSSDNSDTADFAATDNLPANNIVPVKNQSPKTSKKSNQTFKP